MAQLILLATLSLATSTSALCARDTLQAAVQSYILAQSAGKPSLLPLANNVTYQENDTPIDIAKGVLSQAITIDFNRSLLDTTQCATFTELSAATNKHPYVIDTRLLFNIDGTISAIESVVADAGDWAFDAANQLKWTKTEKWDVIPKEKQDTRTVIQAAGDAYLDSWGDASVKVPYGSPCARLEGGSYTGSGSNANANTCKMPQFPQPFKITSRRYVIDEEVGGVDIFNDFPFIDKLKPNGTSSTNFIRVEEGGIRYIHEVTICSTKNCGR